MSDKNRRKEEEKERTFLTKERRFSSSCYAFYSYLQQRMDREEGSSEGDLQNKLVGSFPRKPKKMEEMNPVYSDGLPYTLIKLLLFQCYSYYANKVNVMLLKLILFHIYYALTYSSYNAASSPDSAAFR